MSHITLVQRLYERATCEMLNDPTSNIQQGAELFVVQNVEKC